MISPLKQAIHFSGAPPGEEQPDEAGLELVPRDEVQFFYLALFYFLARFMRRLYFNDNQIRSVGKYNSMNEMFLYNFMTIYDIISYHHF